MVKGMHGGITVHDIVQDYDQSINTNHEYYSFIKVLQQNDKHAFVNALSAGQRNFIYLNKCIPTNEWIETLEKCPLISCYNIYRRAYVGEHEGRRNPSPAKSDDKSVLIEEEIGGSGGFTGPAYNLLIESNKVRRIPVGTAIEASNWVDLFYELDETEKVLY